MVEPQATCRSCGRILFPSALGTAADGTTIADYCASCYRAGIFTRPADTREDATARVSHYLRIEGHLAADEADRRAAELMGVLGGTPLWALRGAGALVNNWWVFGLRGVLAIVFGILALIQPAAALVALVLVFGVWALIDGVSALALAVTGWRSWQLVLVGLLGIGIGLLTFFRPGITAIGLYAAIAAWSIARGILEIVVAVELRRAVRGELWLVIGGISSILFGVLMVVLPQAGVLALAWLIGIYALMFGAIMCALAVRLRQLRRAATAVTAPPRVLPPQPA